jgi:hypothetical protein
MNLNTPDEADVWPDDNEFNERFRTTPIKTTTTSSWHEFDTLVSPVTTHLDSCGVGNAPGR